MQVDPWTTSYAGQASEMSPHSLCGIDQPDSHFCKLNMGRAFAGWTNPHCHPNEWGDLSILLYII